MEDVYLPKHLLMPFFHGQSILYRIAPNLEYTEGELDLTVFGGGLCHIQIRDVSSKLGTTQSVCVPLDSSMLDRVSWDGKKFRGDFEEIR
jgi:hypothetical protein